MLACLPSAARLPRKTNACGKEVPGGCQVCPTLAAEQRVREGNASRLFRFVSAERLVEAVECLLEVLLVVVAGEGEGCELG